MDPPQCVDSFPRRGIIFFFLGFLVFFLLFLLLEWPWFDIWGHGKVRGEMKFACHCECECVCVCVWERERDLFRGPPPQVSVEFYSGMEKKSGQGVGYTGEWCKWFWNMRQNWRPEKVVRTGHKSHPATLPDVKDALKRTPAGTPARRYPGDKRALSYPWYTGKGA